MVSERRKLANFLELLEAYIIEGEEYEETRKSLQWRVV